MSLYFQIQWRDDELDNYSSDKLYYIWNVLKDAVPVELKQELGRVKWPKIEKQRQESVEKIKNILNSRPDKYKVRKAWLDLHPKEVDTAKTEGIELGEIANKIPQMSKQLGAFIELENIEIKYFELDGTAKYELADFKDLFPENFASAGFRNLGITEEQFLKLYPDIEAAELERLLELMGCELEKEDGLELIPYRFAVNAKRILVDGDRLSLRR